MKLNKFVIAESMNTTTFSIEHDSAQVVAEIEALQETIAARYVVLS